MHVPDSAASPFDISPMGEAAILLQASSPYSVEVQTIIWQVARDAAGWPDVLNIVPGVNNILFLLDPAVAPATSIESRLQIAWASAEPTSRPSKLVEVPVSYGGAAGPDLSALSAFTGLPLEDIIERHTAPTYVVLAVGGMPGFGYLGGLDPCLAMPRRSEPRARVVSGSVAIGGSQTAVITTTSPSGWHLIGHTTLSFFDAQAEQPALLSAGDHVRFSIKEVL